MQVPEVMLASDKFKHPSEHYEHEKGRYIVQPKLDGIRALIVHTDGNTRVFGRNTISSGERAEFTESLSEVVEYFRRVEKDFIMDVELMSSDFLTLQTKVRTTTKHIDDPNFYMVAFDMLLYEGVDLIAPQISYESRLGALKAFYKKYIEPSDYEEDSSVYNPKKQLLQLIENLGQVRYFTDIETYLKEIVSQGGEGVIVKDTHSHYEPGKRSPSWIKVLPHREIDVVFTGMVEGVGKYVGTLGALKAIIEGSLPLLYFQVGTGFTDELRNKIWANFSSGMNYFPIAGKIKYKDLYPSGCPRMPVFLQFKEDLV